MDRRVQIDTIHYTREAGTERRALRSRGDRRKHHRALRVLFMPLGRWAERLGLARAS